MTNRQIERLLNDLATVVPAVVDELGIKASTCILQTRVALHVLHGQGVPAQAQPMQLTAMNAVYAELVQTEGPDRENVDLWRERGAWAVTIGNGSPENATRPGYDGHLIALVKRRWLLDLTAGQAARPQHGINVPKSLFIELAREYVDGRRPFLGTLEGGGKLVYQWHDNDDYLRAPDWTRVKPGVPLVRRVLERLGLDGRLVA